MFNREKREADKDIKDRVLSLCEEGDYGICPPPMDAQVALKEIARHLLGENWCVTMPISQEQVNTEIVYAIESRYKKVK